MVRVSYETVWRIVGRNVSFWEAVRWSERDHDGDVDLVRLGRFPDMESAARACHADAAEQAKIPDREVEPLEDDADVEAP
jgi:hypothetical protein